MWLRTLALKMKSSCEILFHIWFTWILGEDYREIVIFTSNKRNRKNPQILTHNEKKKKCDLHTDLERKYFPGKLLTFQVLRLDSQKFQIKERERSQLIYKAASSLFEVLWHCNSQRANIKHLKEWKELQVKHCI